MPGGKPKLKKELSDYKPLTRISMRLYPDGVYRFYKIGGDPKHPGRFSKAGNAVEYVNKEITDDANQRISAILFNLKSMSEAFLKSYIKGGPGNVQMPYYSGHLMDSSSILIFSGSTCKYNILPKGVKLNKDKQHWSKSLYAERQYARDAAAKNSRSKSTVWGKGLWYRYTKDNKIGDDLAQGLYSGVGKSAYVTAVLSVGIPYAEITDEKGTKSKAYNHRGWFKAMEADFTGKVKAIYEKGFTTDVNYTYSRDSSLIGLISGNTINTVGR